MRVFILVIDSFGIGGAKDAYVYGDEGSDTYKSISKGIKIPNLISLGFNNIDGVEAMPKAEKPLASFARLVELSRGKDTVTGHFEIAGIISPKPQPTYPNGFPKDVIDELENAFGVKVLGNEVASGTEIIQRLGRQSTDEKRPIVYTSADSVLQIAANESVIPLERLYEMCEIARKIMCGENAVGRIIARPFLEGANGFYRTENRRDYSLLPPKDTVMDKLKAKGFECIGVAKIRDIFSGRGLTEHVVAHTNDEVCEATLKVMERDFSGLCFVNLVDTDMLYGHRNDVDGYRACVERFDAYLPKMFERLNDDDMFIITADHGCDPSTISTDHSRENVPYLCFVKNRNGENLGTIEGFDFIAKTVYKYLTGEEFKN